MFRFTLFKKNMEGILANSIGGLYTCIFFIIACVTGMCVFSYKFRKKDSNVIHALPIGKNGLYFTGILSGFTMMFAPALLNAALMTALLLVYKIPHVVKYAGMYFLIVAAVSLISLSIASLCCHLKSVW